MHRYYGLTLQLALNNIVSQYNYHPLVFVMTTGRYCRIQWFYINRSRPLPTHTHTHTHTHKTQGTIMMLEKTSVVAVNRSIGEAIYMLSTAPTGLRLPQFGSNFWLVNSWNEIPFDTARGTWKSVNNQQRDKSKWHSNILVLWLIISMGSSVVHAYYTDYSVSS